MKKVLTLSYIFQCSPGLTLPAPTDPQLLLADAPGSPGHILAGGVQVTPTAPSPDIIKNERLYEAVFNDTLFK